MTISLIVAMSQNHVIGNGPNIPWSIPEDMLYFQIMTHNLPVIMGRKTHESIGMRLPNRKNIVISRDKDYVPLASCFKADSIDNAIFIAKQNRPEELNKMPGYEEIFIIGGGEIYAEAIHIAKRVYLTKIDLAVDGDVFFPEFEGPDWCQVINKIGFVSPTKNGLHYNFLVFEKDYEHMKSNLVDTYTRRYNSLISKLK
jgi:dihydrofolate reductase